METTFGQFTEAVKAAKPNANGFTKRIETKSPEIKVRTFGVGTASSNIHLMMEIGTANELVAFLTPEQATAIAASLMAQVQRIAELQSVEP